MNLKSTGKRIVEESPYGMYVWECADGEIAGDGDGNIMNVFCAKGDKRAIEALRAAAKYYGWEEGGRPVWWSGKRPITDEQLEEQEQRARMGLVPDPLDYGAISDNLRGLRND